MPADTSADLRPDRGRSPAAADAGAGPVTAPAAIARGRSGRRLRRDWQHLVFVSPAVLAVLVLGVYPLAFIIGAAVTESSLGDPFQSFVGLESARQVLGDPDVPAALWRNTVYALAVTVVSTGLGVVLALALAALRRTGPMVRTLLLLPMITPPVVVAIVWKLVFNPAGGLLAVVLGALGRDGAALSVLASPRLALLGVAVADVWQWTPLVMLLVYTALLGQDREVLEAAAMDGAHGARLVRHVVLPAVAGTIAAAFFIRLVLAFKVYDLVAVMTAGGPGRSTTMPAYLIHQAALQQFDVDRAAVITLALAVVVTLVTVPVAIATRKAQS